MRIWIQGILGMGIVGLGTMGSLVLLGCEEDVGGFGSPEPEKPGVRVKPEKPAPQDDVPDFANALKMQSSYDAKEGKISVELKIQDGYHAYAPGEEVGIPVLMKVAEEGGWKAVGEPVVPKGKMKDLGALGTSLILEGTVPLTASVQGGTGDITGHVRVQICTKKACDRPRKHPFQIALKKP